MSGDDVLVDVRIRVRRDVYRQLFAEAQRRRLDGAGELVEHMLHRKPIPAPQAPVDDEPKRARYERLERDTVDACLERIDAGELSVRAAARELGVSRGAVYWWRQRQEAERAESAAAHAAAHAAAQQAAQQAALDELGVTGRPPIPVPAVPSL
jgi:DNA invertase Pin-like site-specific DNA recombinase